MANRIVDDWVDVPEVDDWVDVPDLTFAGGGGGEFGGQGAAGTWEPETSYDKLMDFESKLRGAGARGTMTVGRAILGAPATAVKQAGLVRQWGWAEEVLNEQDPTRQTELIGKMAESQKAFDNVADWLDKPKEFHEKGVKAILDNHPEWEADPPESFIDLLKSPDKLAVSLAEAIPLLAGAGIAVVAGQPQIAAALMYVTEGQNMSDQVIADKGSEEEAAIAYFVYGSVAAALETMQLQGIIKVAKGSYNALLNRTVQKVAKGGLRTATMGTIKVAAQEALEEMAQGAWQEITAKMVYDKDIPGGVVDFIDRRAQEAYIGGAMGLIPGVGGGVAGRVAAPVTEAPTEAPVEAPTEAPTEAEAPINVYKTTSGSRTGITEQEIVREGERYVDSVTGEDVVLDIEASGTAVAPAETVAVEKGKKLAFDDIVPDDVLLVLDKRFASLAGVELPESFYEGFDGITFGQLIKGFEKLGIGEEAVSQSTIELRKLGYTQVGNILLTEDGPVSLRAPTPPVVEAKPIVGSLITKQEKDALREEGYSVPDILKMEPTEARGLLGIEEAPAVEPTEVKPKLMGISRNKALKLGHDIPTDTLEWTEAERVDFMQETIGKPSMKNMSLPEMRKLVEALKTEARKMGREYVEPPSAVDELVDTLQETKKVTELEVSKELTAGKLRQLGRKIKSGTYSFVTGLERMERFFESLDGHKVGAFIKNIFKPVAQADNMAIENANQDLTEFQEYLTDQNVDVTLWAGKTEQIGETRWRLTPFQKIGTYMLSLNKNGYRQLVMGMGFSKSDITKVTDSLTSEQKAVAEWLLEKYEQQWGVIKTVAVQMGIDPKKLKKELRYSPIMRTDVGLEEQKDFLSTLVDSFTSEKYDPEHKFLDPRKKGAAGKVELDAATLYMNNIARTNRFLQMGPVAHSVGRILNNSKFKQALNQRTYGQGSMLVNKWMKDAVRGRVTQDNTQWLSRTANIMRRNGIVYAIGYNIPSSLRQSLSLSNAVAVDKAMLIHTPINLTKTSVPGGFKQMQEFVYARSLDVKNASFDRDVKAKGDKGGMRKRLRGKRQWSQKALRWIRWMDNRTRVVAWKSLYDVGLGKFKGDEQQAIGYADKYLARTQPMAHTKDLPHFFRGSTFEKLLTTFQNQVNNNANFYMYDILGAKKAGEISTTEAGHRVMFSYVLPAVLFGMIGRGGLPKDWKDVAVDLATYPIAGAVVVGRWITAMIRGWGSSSTIAEAGPEEFGKLVGAVKRGDIGDIIKYAATTVGAATGRIPAQAIRTAEGVVDIAAGETEDPRRLIYSEWALEQGEQEEISRGYTP